MNADVKSIQYALKRRVILFALKLKPQGPCPRVQDFKIYKSLEKKVEEKL